MAEISDAELTRYRASQELLNQLYDDAETSAELKRLVKKKFPKANIPEIDVLDAADKKIAAMQERLDKRDQAEADEKKKREEADFQGQIERVANERGYTDEGKKKLLNIMQTRRIYDPVAAANEFDRSQPKATPSSKGYSSNWAFVKKDGKDDASFDQLVSDPDNWMVENMSRELAQMNANKE